MHKTAHIYNDLRLEFPVHCGGSPIVLRLINYNYYNLKM